MTSKQALYTELLVLRSQRGNRDALAELVSTWEKPLCYYVRRLVSDRDHADHVMQEAWLKILGSIAKLKDPKCFAAWAYMVTRAAAMDHIRDEYRRQEVGLDEKAEIPDAGVDDIAASDDAEQVHRGLEQLSLRHREILTLFFLQDLSLVEIAAVLDISEGTVKSRLHYAKKAMKKAISLEM